MGLGVLSLVFLVMMNHLDIMALFGMRLLCLVFSFLLVFKGLCASLRLL